MKKTVIFSLTFIFLFLVSQGQEIQNGHFIFVGNTTKSSDFEQSIVKVTQGKEQTPGFSHVGIISIENGDTLVLEATPKEGVTLTEWRHFQDNNKEKTLYLGTLKKEYLPLIFNALQKAKKLLGKKYDFAFDLNNNTYYCSELIYKIFEGTALQFPTPKMTFKKEGSNEFLPFWIDYFEKLNCAIPEGEPGLNPTGMSRSDCFFEVVKYIPIQCVDVKIKKIEFQLVHQSYFIYAKDMKTKQTLLIVSPVSRYSPSETLKPLKKGDQLTLRLEYLERRMPIIIGDNFGQNYTIFGCKMYIRKYKRPKYRRRNQLFSEVVLAHNLFGGYQIEIPPATRNSKEDSNF